MANETENPHAGDAAASPAAAPAPSDHTDTPEFENTVMREFANTELQEREELDPQWWSESTDGRCSEDAALFAASQPAPLSVV